MDRGTLTNPHTDVLIIYHALGIVDRATIFMITNIVGSR